MGQTEALGSPLRTAAPLSSSILRGIFHDFENSAFTRASNTPASLFLAFLLALTISCQRTTTPVYDILILGGEVYDGSGDAPIKADVAISGDRIARIGQVDRSQARRIVDASGQAVTPGFINMLSWSTDSLIADGNSQGGAAPGRDDRDHG